MNKHRAAKLCCFLISCYLPLPVFAQRDQDWKEIPLNSLSAFAKPGPNWVVSGDASTSFTSPGPIQSAKGKGVLVNAMTEQNHSHLITKQQFGDIELELDFMMAKNSNSGVYLMGRYEIQLFDSWTNTDPTFSDCGGIYQRWDDKQPEGRKGYEGVAPLMNVAKAPGMWQHLKLKFTGPRFDAKGKKIADARFAEVYLNGTLVQQQAQVTGPTRASVYEDEKATGPLVIQGDHGAVAVRAIRYRSYKPEVNLASAKAQQFTNPILLNPDAKPYLLRSYMNAGGKKLTHVISAGSPQQLNFSYDMRQGALFQVWRGQFLDVTEMWHERGEPQLAVPLASPLMLGNAPSVAALPTPQSPWPDSVQFDDIKINGYVLDKERSPQFMYTIKGLEVSDKILPQANGQAIQRQIEVKNPTGQTYCRIITAKTIKYLGDDLYAINDKSYFLRIGQALKPRIRPAKNGQELIVNYQTSPVIYSLIW